MSRPARVTLAVIVVLTAAYVAGALRLRAGSDSYERVRARTHAEVAKTDQSSPTGSPNAEMPALANGDAAAGSNLMTFASCQQIPVWRLGEFIKLNPDAPKPRAAVIVSGYLDRYVAVLVAFKKRPVALWAMPGDDAHWKPLSANLSARQISAYPGATQTQALRASGTGPLNAAVECR